MFKIWKMRFLTGLALLLSGGAGAVAQQNGPQAVAPLANASPHYATATAQIEVNQPIDKLWERIGSFCDFGNWVKEPCEITAGSDREIGAVRVVNHRYVEVIVATTQYSYTYAFPPRPDTAYTMFHGTVEARALGPKRSLVRYTQLWDNARLPTAEERQREIKLRTAHLLQELQSMKNLNE